MKTKRQKRTPEKVLEGYVKYRSMNPALYLAALMVTDASQTELWWRKQKRHKIKQWSHNLIDDSIKDTAYKARHHKVTGGAEIGANLAITVVGGVVGGAVGGAVTTASLGAALVPVMAAVAAGNYVVSKTNSVLFGVFRNKYRRNRNWKKTQEQDRDKGEQIEKKIANSKNKVSRGFYVLNKELGVGLSDLSGLKSNNSTELSSLTIDASDAIVRAFDHWHRAYTMQKQVNKLRDSDDEDDPKATLEYKAHRNKFLDSFAIFTHEVAKTQNYLLPCFELGATVLLEFQRLTSLQNQMIADFTMWAAQWLEDGEHQYCLHKLKSVWYQDANTGRMVGRPEESLAKSLSKSLCCYKQDSSTREPIHRRKIAAENFKIAYLSMRSFDEIFEPVDVEKLIESFVGAADHVVEHMERTHSSAEKKVREKLGKVFSRKDNPNSITRMGHSIRNAWSRKTTGEKLYDVIALPTEIVAAAAGGAIGSTVGNAQTLFGIDKVASDFLKEFGTHVIPLAITGIQTGTLEGTRAGINKATKSMPKELEEAFAQINDIEQQGGDHDELLAQLKGSSSKDNMSNVHKNVKETAGSLFKKAARHLVAAKAAYDKLKVVISTTKPVDATSCYWVFEQARLLVSVPYQLRKARLCMQAGLKVVLFMTADVIRWQKELEGYWQFIDKSVLEFVDNKQDPTDDDDDD